jgi:hypothetical protein
MKKAILILCVVAAVVAQEIEYECKDVSKKSPKCGGPDKACVIKGMEPSSYEMYDQAAYDARKKQWEDEGKKMCEQIKNMSKEEKKLAAGFACEDLNCDASKMESCIDKLMDGLGEEMACTPDYEYFCDFTKKTTEGGALCADETDCGLLPCYDTCVSWCFTKATCDKKVEDKQLAPKDAKKCISAAGSILPTLALLLLVLLAL